MRTGIRDVAARANVSPMTVSRVIRGYDEQVQEETRNRVLEAMRELNYVPVRGSSQNKHIETRSVGLVPYYVNSDEHEIDAMTYKGVARRAAQKDYDLLIMLRGEASWMTDRSEARFLDRRCDGFIFVSPGEGEWHETLEALVRNDVPAVVCYQRAVPEGVAWVDGDNQRIINLAIGCLLRSGHRRIAYLAGPETSTSDQPRLVVTGGRRAFDDIDRERVFRRAIEIGGANEVDGEILMAADPNYRLRAGVLDQLSDRGITAVISGDLFALQLWDMAIDAGLSVPGDLSIIGIDDSPHAGARGLTSVHCSYSELGQFAFDAWIDLKRGATPVEASRVVPVRLIERRSVSAPGRPAQAMSNIRPDVVASH